MLRANTKIECEEATTAQTISNDLRSFKGYVVKASIDGHGSVLFDQ